MLEGMRRQGSSVVIYILFGLLIAVFVIQGPGTPGGDRGCGSASSDDTALTVNGDQVRVPTDFRPVYSFLRMNGSEERGAKTSALELLIRRELLAQEAERRGMTVAKEMVDTEVLRGYMFIGGQRVDMRQQFFEKIGDEYIFDHKRRFVPFVQGLNVTSSTFVDQQRRELLAALMAESLRNSVVVSREEALAEFLHENNTASYDVVAFTPAAYRGALQVSEPDVAKYLASHGAEVEAKYKADQALYKGVKEQLRLRHIFVAKAETKPAATGAPATQPAAEAADPGKAKLEAARAEIAAGKRKFEDVAKELSTDPAERSMAGDLGWRTKEFPGLPEPALNAAAKALEVGKVSEVIVSARGFHLLMVQDKRQGDLTLDQVKMEIALELAKDTWAKEAARQAAVAALEAAQRSVIKNLNELYKAPPGAAGPGKGPNLQELLDDPNMTDEQKKRLLEMMLQQSPSSGALELESANVPAAWAEDPAAATGGASTTATPAAAPTAAPAATDGASTTAAPTAAPAAGAGEAAPAAEVDLLKLPAMELPAMSEVQSPTVRRAGPTPRAERLPEVGNSKAAAKALFDQLAAGELAKTIYEANGEYLLVQLIERKSPKMEDFDKDADQRVRGLREARGATLVESWLKAGCEAAKKAGKIKPNAGLVRETDAKGNPLPSTYSPCSSFR